MATIGLPKKKKTWGQAPPNYVAGLGRGATGFTTRSDIGPARMNEGGDGEKEKEEDLSESNYNAFDGYGGTLYSNKSLDMEDAEADAIWEAVDSKMDDRRKERREKMLKEEANKFRSSRPKIQAQFSDLKRDLVDVSSEQWENLPEPGNFTQMKNQRRTERFAPVPDSALQGFGDQRMDAYAGTRSVFPGSGTMSVLPGTRSVVGGARSIVPGMRSIVPGMRSVVPGMRSIVPGASSVVPGMRSVVPGSSTVLPDGSAPTDMLQLGEARNNAMLAKLKRASESVTGQSNIDPRNYMDGLRSIKQISDAEVSDINKARMLFKAMINTNPKHPPAWIAAARLEELAGKLVAARNLALQGCEECPNNEDVWLEAAALHPPEYGKRILAKAIRHIPTSVKIWVQASKLETDVKSKRRVLRKALDAVPNSVRLWKMAVELEEDEEEARILLGLAVECVRDNVDMWLALARLETYANAKKVLNQARSALPCEPAIWITGAKLEEANGNIDAVDKIISKAVKALAAKHVHIDRSNWLKEAENAEKAGSVATCQAIVRHTVGLGVEDEDRLETWIDDAEGLIARSSIATARAVYAHALTVFSGYPDLWRKAADLERNHGTMEQLDAILQQGVKYCPQAEVLWLMGAKEKWKAGDIKTAQSILNEANKHNPKSEAIWLAAVKLEIANREPDRARALLARAREKASSARVWMKSALLERDEGDAKAAIKLLEAGLRKYPTAEKLWMIAGQLHDAALNDKATARATFERGLKNCPNCAALWLCAANLEVSTKNFAKARSVLEKARLKNPKNPDLWLAAVRAEKESGNAKAAGTLMAKALRECPNAGKLWAEAIEMEPRPQQRSKSLDALTNCDNDPNVIVAVARLYWSERKLKKARSFFNRACKLAPSYGDAWAFLYKFCLQHGNEREQNDVLRRCVDAEPNTGERWIRVRKAPENHALNTEQVLKLVALSV